ncbi:hypothetical protein [Flavicella marina]|uniref:hypothetical protein n=1 Tax=Flavicella marina TaxID=1475951 RepID=UPI001265A598|nr:hypothetical protein [Flavicella marina]
MRNLLTFLSLCVILLLSFSCRKDFTSIPSSGNLTFSTDTVFLDTVFSNISSSTYALKVYNPSSDDINIPSINLGRQDSYYRLNVDGQPGTSFQNILLRGKDSLYIFIEGTINYASESPLYTDSIVFDAGDKLQDVKLVTLVQDAHFIYVNNEIDTDTITPYFISNASTRKIHYLTDEEIAIFNDEANQKSIVIYGYCGLASGKTLTIAKNKKIHFHKNSALVIEKDASLIANGTLDEKITIEGDRLEPEFSEIPGQWEAIWLRAGSKNNSLNHISIRNGAFGIVCDSLSTDGSTPTLSINNAEIYNNSEYGILANHSNITAENLVIGNTRNASLAIVNGGTYDVNHATFANYWSGSIRRASTVQIGNTKVFDFPEETSTNLSVSITNSAIDGNSGQELFLEKNESDTFDYLFQNCAIKFTNTSSDPLYDFTDTNHYIEILLNGSANYFDTSLNEFIIGEESDFINKADATNAARTPLDILEVDRTSAPDIGAYQHIIFPTEE